MGVISPKEGVGEGSEAKRQYVIFVCNLHATSVKCIKLNKKYQTWAKSENFKIPNQMAKIMCKGTQR